VPKSKSNFLEKALGRIDQLDTDSIHAVVGRLAQEHQFLETLFDTIHDGVIVVDEAGKILYYNRAATDLLGFPSDGVDGENVTRFIPGLDWEAIATDDQKGGKPTKSIEIEITYPEERFLEVVSAPIDGESKGSAGVMLIFHDATENRKETFEAIESERVQALTLLAASVAHEIGNPLHALHIHLQLFERELKKLSGSTHEVNQGNQGKDDSLNTDIITPDQTAISKLHDYLQVAKGEITRLDLIVRQFLQAIRPVAPRLELDDLNKVGKETIELLRPELDNRGLRVTEEWSEKPAKALIDSDQIKQVLVNLIKNAMQAMTRGGDLTIRTLDDDGGVLLIVEDTGVGISKEKINRIFEPYFTTKKKGTGLGLMIVHRIVDQHGGRIHVEPGKTSGTRFRIWLPREEQGPRLLATGKEPVTE
jgi:two-component system, sporulation sensor kinase E